MLVGIYARTDDGIVRDVLYSLKDGKAIPDDPDVQTHKTLTQFGVRTGKERLFPKHGERFLEALLREMQGSYVWAQKEDQEDQKEKNKS